MRVIVSAIAMPMVASLFNGLPSIGNYLTAILTNIGYVIGGAALLIILRNVVQQTDEGLIALRGGGGPNGPAARPSSQSSRRCWRR